MCLKTCESLRTAMRPLPIGSGQTISQPLIVAHMAEALELAPHERVLEIGTGSGYAAAVLSQIAKEVFTIERHRELAEAASERLKRLGYENVQVRHVETVRVAGRKKPRLTQSSWRRAVREYRALCWNSFRSADASSCPSVPSKTRNN